MHIGYFFFFTMATFPLVGEVASPYDEVVEILPFVDSGWYSNGPQLKALIDLHHVKTVIEVGSYLGQSTIHLAECLPEEGVVYAVDHWLGSPEHQEGEWAEGSVPLGSLYHQFLSNIISKHLTQKIIPLRMDSLTAAKNLKMTADLIYIDAAHDTESVFQDLSAWYLHLNQGGVLCGDDWEWPSVQKGVKRFMKQHRRLRLRTYQNFYYFYEKK